MESKGRQKTKKGMRKKKTDSAKKGYREIKTKKELHEIVKEYYTRKAQDENTNKKGE